MLCYVNQFCCISDMRVNLSKTEIIVFRNGGPLQKNETWKINNKLIKVKSVYKYMGLLFTPKLSWYSARLKLCAQAKKIIFALKRFQYNFGILPHHEMFKLFDSMIVPILTYGSETWGHSYSEQIKKVQIDFCRYFLGINHSVNNCIVLGECGRCPLCVTYFYKCISYWCKLLHMPHYRYPHNCYLMLKKLDDGGRIILAYKS